MQLRASDYLRFLRIKRTLTVTVNLPTTSDKCHRTTKLFHLVEGRPILFSSKCWWIWKEPVVWW